MRHKAHFVSWWAGVFLVAAFILGGDLGGAVAQEQPRKQSPPYTVPQPTDTDNGLSPQQQKDMAKKLNAERQSDIRKDTEKLLELATELKQAVDKTSENTMSLDVIKKADQIEKLAKSVKEKMKGP